MTIKEVMMYMVKYDEMAGGGYCIRSSKEEAMDVAMAASYEDGIESEIIFISDTYEAHLMAVSDASWRLDRWMRMRPDLPNLARAAGEMFYLRQALEHYRDPWVEYDVCGACDTHACHICTFGEANDG